nr:ATPase, T2SS/T4P/T4SS family [Rhodovulum sulfidophilum]
MLNPDGRLVRPPLGGSAVRRALRHGRTAVRRRWRTHPAPRYPSYWSGGSCPQPARLGRPAGERRAVRGPAAARGRSPDLRDPQADQHRVKARRLCGCRDHVPRSGEPLREAVSARANILAVGGTSTGKTTLTNALLAEVAQTQDRVVIIEDTREMQCAAPNLVALRSKDGVASLSDLVRSSCRLRPDRIPICEVRGPEALGLLEASGTGHPGRIGTIYTGSGIAALRCLEPLIQEVSSRSHAR